MDFRSDEAARKYRITREARRIEALKSAKHIPHVLVGSEPRKSCSKCASLKPLSAFHRDSHTWDGLFPSCVSCNSKARP